MYRGGRRFSSGHEENSKIMEREKNKGKCEGEDFMWRGPWRMILGN